jgi:tetratricopeptide (TPR) repeat protein
VGLAPVLTALLLGVSLSMPDETVLEQAGAAFAEGIQARQRNQDAQNHFRQAAELYAELQARGFHNPALYHNEGNAWLLAGDLPRAILAYRRGLRLAPTDRSLQEALSFARGQVHYQQSGAFARPPVETRPPWLPRIELSWWSFGLLFLGYVVAWGLLTRWQMTRRRQFLHLALGVFGSTLVVTVFLLLATAYEERHHDHPLVVIARDEVYLRKGNGDVYPARYETPLHRGVEARLLYRRGDWLQIELSGGEVGWVPESAALVDVPTDRDLR